MKENRNLLRRESDYRAQDGFSLIELLIVVTIMTVIAGFSLFYYTGHANLYKTQDQASRIIDILQLAREKSLSERRVMRVTFDSTTTPATVTLQDEGNTPNVVNLTLISSVKLNDKTEVRNDARPANIATTPNQAAAPDAVYANSFNLRFFSNGTVRNSQNAANNANTPTGATIYVWQPDGNTNNAKILNTTQAITVLGATGAIRLWGYSTTGGWKGKGE